MPYKRLSILFETNRLKNFNFVPLTTSLIPGHVTIDTTSLVHLVLGISQRAKPRGLENDAVKLPIWERVFNLRKKEFKPRADGAKFTGMIETDGISISIHLGPQTRKGSSASKKRKRKEDAGTLYILLITQMP